MPFHATFLALATLIGAPSGHADEFYGFRTPAHAAYCQMESSGAGFSSFRCWTPNDGFWIRFTGLASGNVRVTKGYSTIYRGYHNNAARLLPFGRTWYSSDAAVITCWSRSNGLTCKHYEGLSFWLGRFKGYRIYYDAPGFRPNVRPLFRTPHGIYCGINKETQEPTNPVLICWLPSNGLELGVAHDAAGGGQSARRDKNRGYRPSGFQLLPYGADFYWRCKSVSRFYADGCSTSAGTPVFTCHNRAARLTCTNMRGQGFWATRNSFYVF